MIKVLVCIGLMSLFYKIFCKIWKSLDKFFEEKAKNYATKQDIARITNITEEIQTEFYKMREAFNADLKFKYQFCENQYKELYADLYAKICESEAIRFVWNNQKTERIKFCDIPIVEYEKDIGLYENTKTNTFIEEITELVLQNYIYASPELIKLIQVLINLVKYNNKTAMEEKQANMEKAIKTELVKVILKDYHWLRRELRLQNSEDETEKLERDCFIDF